MIRRLLTDCIVPFKDYLASGQTYIKKPKQTPKQTKKRNPQTLFLFHKEMSLFYNEPFFI